MLKAYRDHAAERAALGIPPLPLDAKQVADLIELIKKPPQGEEAFLLELLTHRVPPGVDDAAKVKASFLAAVAHGDIAVGLVSKAKATELLGTMLGGFNVAPLVGLLSDSEVGPAAAEHDADVPERHLGEQALEAGSVLDGRAADPLVVVDDQYPVVGPSKSDSALSQLVPEVGRLAVTDDLLGRRLADVDDGQPVAVPGSDLVPERGGGVNAVHSSPPSVRRVRRVARRASGRGGGGVAPVGRSAGTATGAGSAAWTDSGAGGCGSGGFGHGADPPELRAWYSRHQRASSSNAHGQTVTGGVVSTATTRSSTGGRCRLCLE